jgi:hypothetical protein
VVDEAVVVEAALLCAEVVEEALVVEADSEAAMVEEEATAEEDLRREDEVSVEEGIGAAAVLASRHTKALARDVSRASSPTNKQALWTDSRRSETRLTLSRLYRQRMEMQGLSSNAILKDTERHGS